MPKVAAPVRDVNPAQLRDEIATALGIPAPYVDRYADRLEVVGMVDDTMADQIRAVIASHVPDQGYGVPTEDRDLRALRAKAQGVWNGTDTFTAAQVQKILAGIILRATRG